MPTRETRVSGLWAMTGLALTPMLLGLSNEISDVDPAQYADVARRILQSHQVFALQDMNGPFINKPPLMMWLQALAMAVLGADSLAARLPALFFALVAIAATWLIGRELEDTRFGATAALLLAGSVAVHHMVADPKVDMALTAMSSMSVWALLASRNRPALLWVAWLFGALGVLSKGPVGLVLPVLAVAPELLRPGWYAAPTTWLARGLSVKPLRGMLLVALLTAPFYLAVAGQGGSGAAVELLFKQGFGRLLGRSGWSDSTTVLYFVHTGAWAFLPATPLVLWGLGRRARAFFRTRALPSTPRRVPLWWFALTFAAVSLSEYKLPQYIYWVAPAAALLAAEELERLTPLVRGRFHAGFGVMAGLSAALGVAVLGWAFPQGPATTAGWCLALALFPAAAWWLSRRWTGPARTAALAVGATSGFLGLFHGFLQPALLEFQPGREVGALVRREDPQGKVLRSLELGLDFSMAFYSRRDTAAALSLADVQAVVAAEGSTLLIARPEATPALRGAGLAVQALARFPSYPTSIPRGRFLLASTRPETLSFVDVLRVSGVAQP